MRYSLSFAVVLGLAALALAGCGAKGVQRLPCPVGMKCLAYGNGSDPTSLDPQVVTLTSEAAIARELFEGLTREDAKGAPIPGMATHWETSPDGLTWTFHLRPARWSDGEPVTADDFVFAYRRILDPTLGSSYAYMLYILKNAKAVNDGKAKAETLGVEALDAHTLRLTLDHPAPYLPQIARHTTFYPVPAHVVRKYGARWTQPGHIVGNGPYVLQSWRLGDYIRVARNPRYYGAERVCIDRVDFYPSPDAVASERSIKRGELDINSTFQSNRITFLRKQMPRYVHTHPYLATTYLTFNTRDVAAFRDVRVRQAISMAVDRKFITDKLMRAGQVPTTSFVPNTMASYVPPSEQPTPYWATWSYPRRQAEARRLLAQAGFGPDHPLAFELKTANATDSVLIAQALQADFAGVGVNARIVQNEGQIAFQSFRIRDFDVGLLSWIADFNDPMNFLTLFQSQTGQQNYGDYKNPRYDALLAQADNEADINARAKVMAQAERLLLDEAAVVSVYNGVNRNLVNPRILGWVDNAVDVHPISYMCVK